MHAILIALFQNLGFLVRGSITFVKWVVAQARIVGSGIAVAFNWYLRIARHNIVLRVAAWGAWSIAIEVALYNLSAITVQPLVSGFVNRIMPSNGSGLLSIFWEHGLNLSTACNSVVAYLGLWAILEMNLRAAYRIYRFGRGRYDGANVFAR